LERLRTMRRTLEFAQTFDQRARFLERLRDPVPAVAVADRALEREFTGAADHDRWMRLLHRLRIKPHAFDLDRFAAIDRLVAGPQLLHQFNVLARAQRAI